MIKSSKDISVTNTNDALHGAAFPLEEYARRVSLVRARMAKLGVEALIIDQVEHMAYLFGYVPPAAIYQPAVLPLKADPFAIVRTFDVSMFKEQSWVKDYVAFEDSEDPVRVLADALNKRGLASAKIAIELDSHFLPAGRYQAIQASLPKVKFIDFSGHIRLVRVIKSDLEIACLRTAAGMADRALMAAVEVAKEGVSERECAAAYYAEVLRAGADNGRNLLMTSGGRSDAMHGRLGNHILESGDLLHVEAVPLYRGYGARIMRSTAIGACSPERRDCAIRLIELQDKQFASMRPGASAHDVDAVLRHEVLKAGLREKYDNFTGYTLGYIGLPVTSDFTRAFLPNAPWALEAGMVFHMYTSAQGLAFSETILVTDEGAERLTKSPRELFLR